METPRPAADDRPPPVVVRGRAYERPAPGEPAPLRPQPVVRRSRTASSTVTFGLAGRLACTLLLALPTVVFLVWGAVEWLFLMVGSWIVAAVALRDVWRAVAGKDGGGR